MSGYDWNKAAEGPDQAPIMDEGWHKAKCAKAITQKKDGTVLTTNKGDRKVICIMENADKEEASMTFTLTERAAGFLAQFLMVCGADLERMGNEGVTPDSFKDQAFASKVLEGRECWIYVTHSVSKGKTYANAEAHAEEDVPAHALKGRETSPAGGASLADDDIPFSPDMI